jgi:putative MATE family efflux protein
MDTTTGARATSEQRATAVTLPSDLGARVRTTWTLAWPVIIAFSLESVVGLIDALMVGRLGADAVAAVGVGVHLLSALNVAMFAAGTGALAIVARHVGAGERAAAEHALRQAILTAFALGVLTVVPVLLWTRELVALFRVEPAVVEAAVPFVRWVILAVPPDAVVFTVAASLRAAGDTRTPLAMGVIVGAVNLVVAYVLIFGALGMPALGVTGAALGTVTAFTVGAVLGIVLLRRGGLALQVRWRGTRVDRAAIVRVLRVGYPSALEHVLMQVGFLTYMVFAAHYGTAGVAAYFIGVRILALSFLPGLGFGAAAGALVGQALGARRPDEAARSGWISTGLSIAFMTAGGLVLYVLAEPVARLFVADEGVVAATVPFIRVLAAAQPLMAIDFTLGGALKGAGDTRFPLVVALLAFYACRLGTSYVVAFVLDWPLVWLWMALIGDYVVRAALKGWRFRSGAWARVRV